MTYASKIANMLQEKGYTSHYPWTGSNGGYSRIYYKKGYVELSGKYGCFMAINLDDESDFVQACKDCVTEYIASKPKVPDYDLPF
jgi:hypothetical protein